MKPQPYIFYSVVELVDGSGPFFLEQLDDVEGEFNIVYHINELILGATSINTIWFDLEENTFFQSVIDLNPLQIYGGISVMLVTGGVAIAWLSMADGCEAVVEMQCDPTTIENVNSTWESERLRLLNLYNRNRDSYSQGVADVLKAIRLQMKRYHYRYNFMVRGDDEIDLILVKELLSDGSIHQMDEESFFNYYHRARPLKVELGWSIGDDYYSAYFFIQDGVQADVFNRFYGIHSDTMSDYIFHIDVENNAYKLALYRQGLKEPVVIPESAYQLIVFKNKFEDYRSYNYNQPRGAWKW